MYYAAWSLSLWPWTMSGTFSFSVANSTRCRRWWRSGSTAWRWATRITTAQIGGGLAQQNAVLIDGGESRGTTESGNAYSVSVEAVSEFRLETASYDAEYGRAAGGVAIFLQSQALTPIMRPPGSTFAIT